GAGLLLASLYGLALGARRGGIDLVRHALGAPAALLVVGAIAVPALFVVLSLFDAPVTLAKTISATARAAASTGLVMAGLAPAATLLAVTIESATVAGFIARVGLVLAGSIGVLPLLGDLYGELSAAPFGVRMKSSLALFGFALFAGALS